MTTTPTPLVTREALRAFTRQMVECYAPEKVILFGSLARGEGHWDSDADILVVMPFEGRHLAKIREMRRLCPVRFPLDLLVRRPEEVEVRYRGGVVEVEQARCDGAAEALLLGMGQMRQVGRQPAQLAPQGGEAGAADAVEVGRLHGQGFEPVGQAAGGADHPFGGKGAQLQEQLGPAAGQALAQIGQHPLAGDAIEHQEPVGPIRRCGTYARNA
jgi:predicted nucleotidyltransferase